MVQHIIEMLLKPSSPDWKQGDIRIYKYWAVEESFMMKQRKEFRYLDIHMGLVEQIILFLKRLLKPTKDFKIMISHGQMMVTKYKINNFYIYVVSSV